MNFLDRCKRRFRILFRRNEIETELSDELGLHLEMEAAELMRQGRTKAEAMREARVLLGGLEYTKQAVRDSRPLGSLDRFALDVKLGIRMLRKSWGLTLVGGLAIMLATAIGVGVSEFLQDSIAPELPLADGDRIVRLYHNDLETGRAAPASLYDLEVWRESVSSIDQLGAYTTLQQGFVGDGGQVGTVNLARISASAFDLTRIPPLMGRFLIEADEQPGAPPVVVLGFEVWQSLLGSKPDPIGTYVELAGTPTMVVGIMPARYGFPEIQNAWVPIRLTSADQDPESARQANIFGRLAPGATLESAGTELSLVGRRAATEFPEFYERSSPTVVEFARRATNAQLTLLLSGVRLVLICLLVVASANVATLVFARTITREGELAVRLALGATRRRIVIQLAAEALLLAGTATVLGLLLARFALEHIGRLVFVIQQQPELPFWWNDSLSASTLAYAITLVLVAMLIIGVVPALKATGGLRPGLVQRGRDGGNLRFGGIWAAMIVLQIALSVALLPIAVGQNWNLGGMRVSSLDESRDAPFPAEEFLTGQLGRDQSALPRSVEQQAAFFDESQRLFTRVKDQIASDPGVLGTGLASGLSAMNHITVPVEFLDERAAAQSARSTRILLVDPDYLQLMGATLVAGRLLTAADFSPNSRSVLVNEAFVDGLVDRQSAVGGQLRFPERVGEQSIVRVLGEGSTVDIVGIVRNPAIDAFGPGSHAAIYAPFDLAPVTPLSVGLAGMPAPPATQLFVRLASNDDQFVGRLYEIVNGVDASLRLSQVGTAAQAWGPVHQGERLAVWIFNAVVAIVLGLSIAGISALMSFTVSRRTREIAIRIAIGAQHRQIVRLIFRRTALQLLAGTALGSLVAIPVLWDGLMANGPRTIVIVCALLVAAILAACLLPIRRALAIEPTAAINSE